MKAKLIIGNENIKKSFATVEEIRQAFREAELNFFSAENCAKSEALLYKTYQKRVAENPEYYAMIEKAIAMSEKERELPVVIKSKFFNFKFFRKYAK